MSMLRKPQSPRPPKKMKYYCMWPSISKYIILLSTQSKQEILELAGKKIIIDNVWTMSSDFSIIIHVFPLFCMPPPPPPYFYFPL